MLEMVVRSREAAVRQWAGLVGRHLTPHWGFWAVIMAVAGVDVLWVASSQRFSFPGWFAAAALLVPVMVMAVLIFRHLRDATFDPLLAGMFRVLMFILFAAAANLSIQTLNCLLMSLGRPLADPVLGAADRALGFDWNAYALWIASQPWLRRGLLLAYSGMVHNIVPLLVGALVFLKRDDRINELAYLSIAAPLACIVIAAWFPAEAAWVTVANERVVAAYRGDPYPEWLSTFNALRGTAPMTIDPTVMGGLATFPSFHTCLGLILLWCCRGHWLTLGAGAAGGLAVIAATPVFGGHYLVDMLAGGALMLVLILVWQLSRRRAD